MSTSSHPAPEAPHSYPTSTEEQSSVQMPPVPYTLDGAAVLHQMLRIHWDRWHALSEADQAAIVHEAKAAFLPAEESGKSGLFSLLGHRGDLMWVHFRNSVDELNQFEMLLNSLRIRDFLEISHSYLSVVELGLYASTSKIHQDLSERGFVPHSEEWNQGVEEVLARQRKAMEPRLWPDVPAFRYCCFYPMDRRRGEVQNWYALPLAERQRMMHEHGLIGRRYHNEVRQIISGSIGFDNWEWGVDLFADNPLVFKKLIYEMRFDEVSAVYGLFGDFYVGLRFSVDQLDSYLKGTVPSWSPSSSPQD
jgi:peroxiredoxin